MKPDSIAKIKSIIEDTISLFNLNLKDTTVLTEAANGHFFITPILAAIAGADVIAITKDSAYGKKEDVRDFVSKKAELFAVDDKISFVYDTESNDEPLLAKHIAKADIITNLGFVRPIDNKFLEAVKEQAVIAGMCEEWEIRGSDIDLTECRRRGIPVVAVNEQSDFLDIFKYVGYIAMKMMYKCGLPVYRSRVLVVSNDKFGTIISDVLSQCGAITSLVSKLTSQIAEEMLQPYDVIVLADLPAVRQDYESVSHKNDPSLDSILIKRVAPDPILIHIAGKVDRQLLTEKGIICYPEKDGLADRMSETLSYLGIRPVIELHTAGLAAASIVRQELEVGQSYQEMKDKYADHPLCRVL